MTPQRPLSFISFESSIVNRNYFLKRSDRPPTNRNLGYNEDDDELPPFRNGGEESGTPATSRARMLSRQREIQLEKSKNKILTGGKRRADTSIRRIFCLLGFCHTDLGPFSLLPINIIYSYDAVSSYRHGAKLIEFLNRKCESLQAVRFQRNRWTGHTSCQTVLQPQEWCQRSFQRVSAFYFICFVFSCTEFISSIVQLCVR